jgi:hypothetical protein
MIIDPHMGFITISSGSSDPDLAIHPLRRKKCTNHEGISSSWGEGDGLGYILDLIYKSTSTAC